MDPSPRGPAVQAPPAEVSVPRGVYEILAQVGLRQVEAELAAGRGDQTKLERTRENLRKFLGLAD